jgi:hypothetical protein
MLRGLGCSYYPGAKNIAIHTDLCSPLATDPTWSRLSKAYQEKLIPDGVEVWHKLVEFLCPHVIIVSVAAHHLERIRFTRLEGWREFFTVQRQNPYTVKLMKVGINEQQAATVIFGKAANTPFGTVSNHDKEKIGQSLRGYLDGK